MGTLPLPPGTCNRTPLGQTVPCLLIPLANRNAIGQPSAGRPGQAEMPGCLGVSTPHQVVSGLHHAFIVTLFE